MPEGSERRIQPDDRVLQLSAGDVEMMLEGNHVGPWLHDDGPVYVEMDRGEAEKLEVSRRDE